MSALSFQIWEAKQGEENKFKACLGVGARSLST